MPTFTELPVEVTDAAYVKVAEANEDFSLTVDVRAGALIAFADTEPTLESGVGHKVAKGGIFESVDATNPCWIRAQYGKGHFTKTWDKPAS